MEDNAQKGKTMDEFKNNDQAGGELQQASANPQNDAKYAAWQTEAKPSSPFGGGSWQGSGQGQSAQQGSPFRYASDPVAVELRAREERKKKAEQLSLAAFFLSIAAYIFPTVTAFIPVVQIFSFLLPVTGPIGMILGIVSLKKYGKSGLAIAAVIIGAIYTVSTILGALVVVLLLIFRTALIVGFFQSIFGFGESAMLVISTLLL